MQFFATYYAVHPMNNPIACSPPTSMFLQPVCISLSNGYHRQLKLNQKNQISNLQHSAWYICFAKIKKHLKSYTHQNKITTHLNHKKRHTHTIPNTPLPLQSRSSISFSCAQSLAHTANTSCSPIGCCARRSLIWHIDVWNTSDEATHMYNIRCNFLVMSMRR